MRTYIILAALLISACMVNGQTVKQTPEEFALHLKNIITSRDISNFKKLPLFPQSLIDDDEIDYVFGLNGQNGFVDFLSEENVQIKLYGPYPSEGMKDVSYTLVYFDPNQVKFNLDGYVDRELIRRLWGKGYLETVISQFNDRWGFHRSIFYYGAHAPWADDY